VATFGAVVFAVGPKKMPVFWFLLDQALAIAFATVVASRCAANETWRRLLVGCVVFVAITCVSTLVAGVLGHLDAVGVTVVLVAATLPLLVARIRSGPQPATAASAQPVRGRWRDVALPIALAGFTGVAICRVAIDGSGISWDDLSYHAALPVHWLTTRRIDLPAFTYQAYFPMNAELMASWFLLPFHADAAASFAGALFLAIAAISLFGLARMQGATPTTAFALVVALLVSTSTWKVAATFCATDLAGPALVLAALALAGRSGDRRPARRDRTFLYVGLAAGFAVGCRPNFAPALLLIGAWRGWLAWRDREDRNAWRDVAWLLAGALVTGSFWYVRNAVTTGNPLYPLQFGPWEGPLRGEPLEQTRLIAWMNRAGVWTHPEFLRRLANLLTGWPDVIGLLGAIGYLSLLMRTSSDRDASRPARSFRALLSLVGIVSVAIYPWLPFSATCNRPGIAPLNGQESRYLVLMHALGVALLAGSFRPERWRKVALVGIGLACVVATPRLVSAWSPAGCAAFVLAALGSALPLAAWRSRPRIARSCVVLLVVAVLGVFAHFAARKQAQIDDSIFSFEAAKGPIGRAWQEIDRLPAGSRVTVFASDPLENVQIYPLFGRRWQLEPRFLDADGSEHRPLHLAPPVGWWSAWNPPAIRCASSEFLGHLRSARIDFVLCTRWMSGKWPKQQSLLCAERRARVVYRDDLSTIWQVSDGRVVAAADSAARASLGK